MPALFNLLGHRSGRTGPTSASSSRAKSGDPDRASSCSAWWLQFVFHRLIDRLVKRAEEGCCPSRLSQAAFGRGGAAAAGGIDPPGAAREDHGQPAEEHHVGRDRRRDRITMMLSRVGLDIGPVIASAGIIGVALGFGSQTLVKDFLSGIFMIFEDQYGVGDVVDLGEASPARSRRSACVSPGCATPTAPSGTSATASSCGSAT